MRAVSHRTGLIADENNMHALLCWEPEAACMAVESWSGRRTQGTRWAGLVL